MEDLKVYQVKSKWNVFRIPFGTIDKKQCERIFQDMENWLDQTMTQPYKIFHITGGEAKSFYLDGKRTKNLSPQAYKPLMQIDIYDDKEAALFKLTWG